MLIKLITSNCSKGEFINRWPVKLTDLKATDAEETRIIYNCL